MLLSILVNYVHDAESKIAYCITCEMSVGNPIQAAAHYRSREHLNRRLQRGLPVMELSSAEQDQSSANRQYINDCLQRGIGIPQPNVAQPGMFLYFICRDSRKSRKHGNHGSMIFVKCSDFRDLANCCDFPCFPNDF